MTTLCRWGFLSTANIARKNWKAIGLAGNSRLVAVASRDRSKAQKFIDECQASAPHALVPEACGGYEELIARKDIDAVYIPLPTGVRKEWVIRAAQAGKHVLCEKPCGVTAADVREMTAACQQAGVQFMDGVMFMHSQRLPLLRQTLDDGRTIGKVLRVASHFTFKGNDEFLADNIRVNRDLEPLGALGDLGWYNIRFSLWAMQEQLPDRVSGRILTEKNTVPLEFSGELLFSGEASASFYCSFITENQQWAHISGTSGSALLSDFVLPFFGAEAGFEVNAPIFRVQGCDFNMESHPRRHVVNEYSNGMPGAQEVNMIRTFAGLVLSGKTNTQWANNAVRTQQVMEACLASAREQGKLVVL